MDPKLIKLFLVCSFHLVLFYLSKLDTSRSDVALISNKKILETGTANIFFVKDGKFYIPKKNY